MSITPVFRKSIEKIGTECIVSTKPLFARSGFFRQALLQGLKRYIQIAQIPRKPFYPRPVGVTEDMNEFFNVIIHTTDRIPHQHLSRPVMRKIAGNLINGSWSRAANKRQFQNFVGLMEPTRPAS